MKKAALILLVILFVLSFRMPVAAEDSDEQKWQDESIYYIVVDRFMNGENTNNKDQDLDDPQSYHGGDLFGVADQLDYIKGMGFTTIQLSPIMQNEADGFHGFHVTDYRGVNENFGSMEQAKRVVDEAHARDMKVIFDLPSGFVGPNHPWLEDESKSEWFTGESLTMDHPWFEGLPEVGLTNEEVQQYFLETMDYWQEETGVDGFHLIGSSIIPESLAESGDRMLFTTSLSQKKPFRNKTREAFSQSGNTLEQLMTGKNEEKVHQVDYYDTQRFTHLAFEQGENPITRWSLALTYLFTAPGIPQVYYGTETPIDDGGDLQHLPMMNFKTGDEKLKKRIEKLTSMRAQFPVLTNGNYEELYNEEGLAVIKRSYEDQTMIIAINNAEKTNAMEINDLKDDQQLRGLLHDGLVRQQSDGTYRLGMERETADVFVVEPNSGYNWLFIGFVGGILGLFVVAVTMISVKNRRTEKSL